MKGCGRIGKLRKPFKFQTDFGSQGPLVFLIQLGLMLLGFTADGRLKVDGIFEDVTARALRFFQDAYCLVADGRVGPATLPKVLRPVRQKLGLHGKAEWMEFVTSAAARSKLVNQQAFTVKSVAANQ